MRTKIKLLLPLCILIMLVSSMTVSAGFYGVIDGDVVNVRQYASTDDEVVGKLGYGTPVNVIGYISSGWYKISCGGIEGWIHENYIITKPQMYEELPQNSSEGEKIATFAMGYLGYPYVYGASSPETGFDCSGFVKYVMNSCGYEVNRIAADQAANGRAVSDYELLPGDLLFFASSEYGIDHVGIYIGNGKMIHASQETTGVIISELSGDYYTNTYVGARRIAE